jgi:hypothetical protein
VKREEVLHSQAGQVALFRAVFDLKIGDLMETNPYNYDTTVPWIPQQNQQYQGRDATARTSQQRPPALQNQRPQQTGGGQKTKPPERMPKARALALARTLKKWLVIASLVSFGTFSGLVAYHQVATAASQTSSGSSQATPASNSSSSSQNSNGFFNQQGGNNFGSGNSSQGSSSGSSVS